LRSIDGAMDAETWRSIGRIIEKPTAHEVRWTGLWTPVAALA
jgi:hypothetical protein